MVDSTQGGKVTCCVDSATVRQPSCLKGRDMLSWAERLQGARAEAATQKADPWHLRLERVRGKVDYDGLERVSTQSLLDLLEVPQRSRTTGVFRRLARIM